MKPYAELDHVRTRQQVTDAVAAAAVVGSILLGVLVHRLVAAAAAPGEAIEDAGDAVGGLPGLGGAGGALADAGQTLQDVVLGLAFWMGAGLAIIGVVAVLAAYLPGRLAWMREAAAAAQLRDRPSDVRLLAYRAVARRPLALLVASAADPGAALANGDYRELAGAELDALGLRRPW